MTRWPIVAAVMLVPGCAPPADGGRGAPAASRGMCRDEAATGLVGRVLDAALSKDAQARSGARDVRVLRPGEAATMDFRADRLTIMLDEARRIVSARCG